MDPLNGIPHADITTGVKAGISFVWKIWGLHTDVLEKPVQYVNIPQQPSETEYGFYVMACIHNLIKDVLQRESSKNMVSFPFHH